MTLGSTILNQEIHALGLYCSTNIAKLVKLMCLQQATDLRNHLV